jgi:hypothetical protein
MLCALDFDTAEWCIDTLPPEGLFVTIGVFDQNPGREYDHWLEKHCAHGITEFGDEVSLSRD